MTFQLQFLSSLSKDEIICDQKGGDVWIAQEGYIESDFLTINLKEYSVHWYSQAGYTAVRSFQLSKPPLDAIFCILNDNPVETVNPTEIGKSTTKHLCVAILAEANEVHLYYPSGERYEIMLPASCKYLVASSLGLLFQATIFNVVEHYLPLELDNSCDDLHQLTNQFLLPTSEIQETNVILYLNSPNSSVDVINTSFSGVYANYLLASSYYNLIYLLAVQGNSLLMVSIDPILKDEETSNKPANTLDQTFSASSLLLRSLTSDSSINKSGGSNNQSKVSHAMSITPNSGIGIGGIGGSGGSGGRIRPPSRSSPSPTVFTKSLSVGANQLPSQLPNSQRTSPAILETSNNSGGGLNQYSGDTLQNLLGLKRQTSRDQDRNLVGITNPNASNATRYTSNGGNGVGVLGAGASLERSHSIEEIDFTMNTIIDEIYNDVLPFTEAKVTFRLKWTETIIESIEKGANISVRLIGNLWQGGLFVLVHLQDSNKLKVYEVERIEGRFTSLKSLEELSLLSMKLSHRQTIQLQENQTIAYCTYTFNSSFNLESSSSLWHVPLVLVHSTEGDYKLVAVATQTIFSFPSENIDDQQNWIARLLQIEEEEDEEISALSSDDRFSPWNALPGKLLSLNGSFTNFIIDSKNKKRIGAIEFSAIDSNLRYRFHAMMMIFHAVHDLLRSSSYGLVNSLNSLWIRLSFMKEFHQKEEFFLVILCLLLQQQQLTEANDSFASQLKILLGSCYDVNAREEIFSICQEMKSSMSHEVSSEGSLTVARKILVAILLVGIEMSLQNTSSSEETAAVLIGQSIDSLLQQLEKFLLQSFRSFFTEPFLLLFESFFTSIKESGHHQILQQISLKKFPFQSDAEELIHTWKLSLYSNLFIVLRFFAKLQEALLPSIIEEEFAFATSAVRVVTTFIDVVVELCEKSPSLSERQWKDIFYRLPSYLQYLLALSFQQSRLYAVSSWPIAILKWMNRNDLCANLNYQIPSYLTRKVQDVPTSNANSQRAGSNNTSTPPEEVSDGLVEVENESILRFPEDDRVHEVCRLLRSSVPCYLKLERSPESSETEFRQKQQMRLLTICRRTLACPVGRGMLTIATMEPLMAEALPIPPLSLNGRVPPTNSIVTLDLSSAHVDLKLWPEFHNGVAAALRVGPADTVSTKRSDNSSSSSSSSSSYTNKKRVTRNWIIYNKTASQSKPGGDSGHAGFLLGMGLFGHLAVLTITDICDYLTQGHEPTTIAILIGVAASKISTADALLSKTLCLHLPTLLPAQHWDIEISPLIQCSALVGLGFLYCRSGHRLMVQFLLEELSRKPTSDRCECREALALSAAWALAMVLLPKKLCPPPPSKPAPTSSSSSSYTAMDLSPTSTASMQTSPQPPSDADSPPQSPDISSVFPQINQQTRRRIIPPSPFRPASRSNSYIPPTAEEAIPTNQQNETLKTLEDLKIEDCLHTLINGGSRPIDHPLFPGYNSSHPSSSNNNMNYDVSAKSSRILEGEQINREVTAPGACLALGLIYLSSNHPKILRFLELPQTVVELDSIRPDLLIYRCIGRCLIQWEDYLPPTNDWLDEQMPLVIQKAMISSQEKAAISSLASSSSPSSSAAAAAAAKPKYPKYVGPYGKARHTQNELSASTAFSLYVNIIAGYCLGIGVVYAGTFHEQAKQTILSKLKWLQSLRDNKITKKLPFILDKTHRNMIEMCLSSVALALSCVMAGSGDVQCLQILRELRWKVEEVIYGTHLALNMAIGMLFLGGGKYSLKRDPVSTASLLLAILPRYPSRSVDHQYHLQALRHLYVLAVESRVLHTVDIDTGLPISVDLQLELIDGKRMIAKVPGLLPQLNTVKSISVIDYSKKKKEEEVQAKERDEKEGQQRLQGSRYFNQYYPCRIDLMPMTLSSSSSSNAASSLSSTTHRLSNENQRILLPTFYVKKLPAIVSHSSAAVRSTATATAVSGNTAGPLSIAEITSNLSLPSSGRQSVSQSSMVRAILSHRVSSGSTEEEELQGKKNSETGRKGNTAQLLSNWILQTPDLQQILLQALANEL